MTKEQAINNLVTISEILVSESKQHISADEALDKIRALMPCCDTIIPLLNEPKWNKVEEEQPTETGDYLTAFMWKEALQLVPPTIEYRVCRYIKDYGWQEFGWKTLAWQKIEEFTND